MELTLKQYNAIRLTIIIVLAMFISNMIALKNFLIPVILIVISSLLLMYLRKRVKGVLADERDYQIGGKAALLSIQIFSWISVLFMFLFYWLSQTNYYYYFIALTLAFSVCGLMFLYSFIFRFYFKK